ncbi:hypothetical protein FKM82_019540 [Ascaphus truei]
MSGRGNVRADPSWILMGIRRRNMYSDLQEMAQARALRTKEGAEGFCKIPHKTGTARRYLINSVEWLPGLCMCMYFLLFPSCAWSCKGRGILVPVLPKNVGVPGYTPVVLRQRS